MWAAFARTPRISAPAPFPRLGNSRGVNCCAKRHPGFDVEMAALLLREPREHRAVTRTISRLLQFGDALRFPDSSSVRSSSVRGLRELRPRRGRSRWRPLYVITAGGIQLAALAPEATRDPVGYRRAVDRAAQRLSEMTAEENPRDVE
jgi:hypothetical protein